MENSIINQFLLEDRLKEYFFGKEKKIAFIRADESLPYGYVIHIMDIAKKAGVEVIGLITRQPEKEEK